MFEDQKVELLPERTTMASLVSISTNVSIALALNAGNVNIGGQQLNAALVAAAAGSKIG
jgi:ABC-type uncharacterized transport system permease subunit